MKKIISKDGNIVLTKARRAGTMWVTVTVQELETLAKEAKKFSKSKMIKNRGGAFFRHLSDDVTFMILPKGHVWLNEGKEHD